MILALRNMLVRVGADVTGFRRGLTDASKSMTVFKSSMGKAMGGIKGLIASGLGAIAGGLFIQSGIEDAMKFEAIMATLGDTMGASMSDFVKWQETVGTSLGFSRLQSAQLANTLSLNFKMIASSQHDLVMKTTKMMEVASLIAQKRGMTMEEVSDRIRSAMNQEADGADELGVNVRIGAIQQSKAYKEMANGKPWAQLNSYQQKTILYNAILEQVTANLGTTVQDTAQKRMATFTASLLDVRLALGQAFLPIVYAVLPYLTAFMQGIYKALQWISAFSRALFGGFKYNPQLNKQTKEATQATNAQTQAVGNLGRATAKAGKQAKQAGKDAKGGVAGFDEVNTLAESSANAGVGAGGGGGGGGIGGGGIPQPNIPGPPDLTAWTQAVDKMVKSIKEKLGPVIGFFKAVWDNVSGYFKSVWTGLKAWWDKYGASFQKALIVVWTAIQPIVAFLVAFIWDSIKGLIDGVIKFFEGLIEFFSGIFTGNWKEVWQGLQDMVFGAVKAIWNFFNLYFIVTVGGALRGLLKSGSKIFLEFGKAFTKPMESSVKAIVDGITSFIKTTKRNLGDFRNWVADTAMKIALKIFDKFDAIKNVGAKIVKGIKDSLWTLVNWVGRSVVTPIVNRFDKIKTAFSRGLGSGFRAVVNTVIDALNRPLGWLRNFGVGKAHPFAGLPHIPPLAEGGIATRATLALVGEGRGPEAITPIDKLQGYVATAVMQAMQFMGGNQQQGNTVLKLDGRTFARVIKPYLDKETKRVGTNIRLNSV